MLARQGQTLKQTYKQRLLVPGMLMENSKYIRCEREAVNDFVKNWAPITREAPVMMQEEPVMNAVELQRRAELNGDSAAAGMEPPRAIADMAAEEQVQRECAEAVQSRIADAMEWAANRADGAEEGDDEESDREGGGAESGAD